METRMQRADIQAPSTPEQYRAALDRQERVIADLRGKLKEAQSIVSVETVRFTYDGALAECPCCGSLDVGAAGGGCTPSGNGIVNCYKCGLTIKANGPMQEAIDLWNRRKGRYLPTPRGQ